MSVQVALSIEDVIEEIKELQNGAVISDATAKVVAGWYAHMNNGELDEFYGDASAHEKLILDNLRTYWVRKNQE